MGQRTEVTCEGDIVRVTGTLSPLLLGPGGTGGYNENDLPGD